MADKQFDLSPAKQQVLIEKAKRRETLRSEFLKLSTDPARHASNEGGYVFDPAMQRFLSMKVTHYDHFKATPKTVGVGLAYFLVPFLGFTYLLYTSRTSNEQKLRNGEVAYKDRSFKLV